MKHPIIAAALTASLCAGGFSFAARAETPMPELARTIPDDSTYAERLAAAKPYVEAATEEMDIDAMISNMSAPIAQLAAQQGHPLDADQKARLDALYHQTLDAPMRQLVAGQAEMIAKTFTMQEINALSAFYGTPVGHSILSKMPEVTKSIQPAIMQLVQTTIPKVLPQIRAIIQNRN